MRLESRGDRPVAASSSTSPDDDDDDDDEDDDDEEEDDEDDDDDDEDEDEEDEDWRGMIEKERALRETLSSLGSVVVAYSGGVDSAYLACIATTRSATARCAVTADSPSYPERHRQMAIADRRASSACATRSSSTSELERPEYRANPANRCYYCKHELYTHLARIAAERRAVVVDGNNADDRGDYRPGPAGGARVRRAQPARRGRSRPRTRSASCRAARGCRPGTSRRRPACRRAFRITPK